MNGRHELVAEYRRLLRHGFTLTAASAPPREAASDFLEAERRLAAFLGDDLAAAVLHAEMNRWYLVTGRCATCGRDVNHATGENWKPRYPPHRAEAWP